MVENNHLAYLQTACSMPETQQIVPEQVYIHTPHFSSTVLEAIGDTDTGDVVREEGMRKWKEKWDNNMEEQVKQLCYPVEFLPFHSQYGHKDKASLEKEEAILTTQPNEVAELKKKYGWTENE